MTLQHRFLSLGVAVTALALAGCNGGTNTTDTTGTTAGTTGTTGATAGGTGAGTTSRRMPTGEGVTVTGDTIKIGVIGSLTGDQKPWGEDSIEGARLAVAEANAGGGVKGKKIEMLIGDSASKADQAKTAAEKLISQGVVGIVGEVASGHTIQIAKSAFERAVPVVAIGATKTDLTNEGAHVVRVCYTDDFQGPVMAKFAYDELGLRSVALMTDNKQPYSQYLSQTFSQSFQKLGGKIAGEVTYETGQTQFNSQVTELKNMNPDGVFLSGYFPEVGPIARQIKQAGMDKVKLMGGDGWDSPQLLVSGGEAIYGGFFCNHYNNKEERPEVKEFLTKWRAKHGGKDPGTTMGALGYDAMKLMIDGINRAESLNSVAIINALNDTENFAGVSGAITLKGQNGNPLKRALVVEVRPLKEGFQVFRKAYEANEVAL